MTDFAIGGNETRVEQPPAKRHKSRAAASTPPVAGSGDGKSINLPRHGTIPASLVCTDPQKQEKLKHARETTSGSELLKLAQDQDPDVREVVAGNLRTPMEALALLATDRFAAVRAAVAGNPGISQDRLDSLSGDRSVNVRTQAARNPKTLPATLSGLAGDANTLVLSQVARNPNTPLDVLRQLATAPDPVVRCALAQNPLIMQEQGKDLVLALCRDANSDVLHGLIAVAKPYDFSLPAEAWNALALNPKVPDDILLNLLAAEYIPTAHIVPALSTRTDLSNPVRFALAGNRHMQAETLARMAHDPEASIRLLVATHHNTPESALVALASDPDKKVRWYLARQDNAPAEALLRLAGDGDVEIRAGVANNPHAPAEALDRLSTDNNTAIRQGVAGHAAASLGTLCRMAGKDPDATVQRIIMLRAKDNKLPEEIFTALSTNPAASHFALCICAESPYPAALRRVLQHPLVDNEVRAILAANAAAPGDVLEKLAKFVDLEILQRVSRHSNLTPAAADELIYTATSHGTDWLLQMARDNNTSDLVLERLAKSPNREVKKTACKTLKHKHS